ncbi:membrane protein [Thermus scotoductus]|uniref:membrane protein n=1 Tax=Thermus scotoductus TaxID=37636 RepID=UPI00036D97EF|nr:membrane protein [Thermus scotoductus]
MNEEALLALLSVAALEALLSGDNALVLAGYVVAVMERYPSLEKVAYALVGWAGVKLLLEGSATLAELLHRPELAWRLPKPVFWGVTFLILLGGSLLALRKHA